MMTGKKEKLTQLEKECRKLEVLKEKKAWVDENMGGFTRIYPL